MTSASITACYLPAKQHEHHATRCRINLFSPPESKHTAMMHLLPRAHACSDQKGIIIDPTAEKSLQQRLLIAGVSRQPYPWLILASLVRGIAQANVLYHASDNEEHQPKQPLPRNQSTNDLVQWEESSIDRLTAVDLRLGSWTGFKCPDWPDRSRLGPPN